MIAIVGIVLVIGLRTALSADADGHDSASTNGAPIEAHGGMWGHGAAATLKILCCLARSCDNYRHGRSDAAGLGRRRKAAGLGEAKLGNVETFTANEFYRLEMPIDNVESIKLQRGEV